MTKIELRTVKARKEAGLGISQGDSRATVALTMTRLSRRSAGESLQLIQEFVAANDGVTRYQIAAFLNRKETPGLRALIEHLVEVDILEKSCEPYRGITGVQYLYRLAE